MTLKEIPAFKVTEICQHSWRVGKHLFSEHLGMICLLHTCQKTCIMSWSRFRIYHEYSGRSTEIPFDSDNTTLKICFPLLFRWRTWLKFFVHDKLWHLRFKAPNQLALAAVCFLHGIRLLFRPHPAWMRKSSRQNAAQKNSLNPYIFPIYVQVTVEEWILKQSNWI